MEIAADYLSKTKIFQETAADFVQEISNLEPVHSVRFRIKNPEHLIEKIIRKSVEYENTDIQFNKDTYLIEITDIIGIRALYVFKNVEFQNGVDYRSIHYTIRHVNHEGILIPIEIQTRSIFEEGWSEINHKLLYKREYSDIAEKALLIKTSSVLSSLAGDCDTLGDLMKSIAKREEVIDILDNSVLLDGRSIIDEIIKNH